MKAKNITLSTRLAPRRILVGRTLGAGAAVALYSRALSCSPPWGLTPRRRRRGPYTNVSAPEAWVSAEVEEGSALRLAASATTTVEA
jgi:hypothetical protein